MEYFDTRTVEYMTDIDLLMIKEIMIEEISRRKKTSPKSIKCDLCGHIHKTTRKLPKLKQEDKIF